MQSSHKLLVVLKINSLNQEGTCTQLIQQYTYRKAIPDCQTFPVPWQTAA